MMNLKIDLPSGVKKALILLKESEYEAYVVGGAVRDCLLHLKNISDWDITTSATPDEIKKVFSLYKVYETGIKHGTVTVVIENLPIEITTYRTETEYSDHRHPNQVVFTKNLSEDLLRRDFTINALAYSEEGKLTDNFGGLADLDKGIIRCVGKAEKRFDEDALRILRALRFASVLEMKIEENTLKAAFCKKELLRYVAEERIREELTKLLLGKNVANVLLEYKEIISVVIEEIKPMLEFEKIWEQTAYRVENSLPESDIRWAALLKDIGKPKCSDSYSDFGAEIANDVFGKLCFDKKTQSTAVNLIRMQDVEIIPQKPYLKKLLNEFGESYTKKLIYFKMSDLNSQSLNDLKKLYEAKDILREITDNNECYMLKDLNIKGGDLRILGLSGKKVGEALKGCLEAVINDEVANKKEDLLEYVKNNYPK